MTTALLVIDIQRDYFEGGAMQLPNAEAAATQAAVVLDSYRSSGSLVVHLQHIWDAPDATFMIPGTVGVEIHPDAAPHDGEPVLTKELPNGFMGTGLENLLRDADITALTIVGMMSNMCVDGTARAGSDLGFDVTVVHDACAASDLEFDDASVPAGQVHAAFMAALADAYASVVSTDALLAAAQLA
ncbi:MAG: Isochorismatase [Aeromicrobium sp.]|nr:Isochorismatase [Aeromicrobium sp.]